VHCVILLQAFDYSQDQSGSQALVRQELILSDASSEKRRLMRAETSIGCGNNNVLRGKQEEGAGMIRGCGNNKRVREQE
jgi:hypothetical protein